jgi:heme-degrading monooxygenase HmoA
VHRSAWAETTERLRAAATTEPGRLRIIGAALALLVVAFGAVTAWETSDRFAAAHDVVRRSQPLSADAADIYRSLADADTAAASAFLAGAKEPPAVQQRYQDDITRASRLLVKAASNTSSSGQSGRQIATLNEGLPRYTGLIERARANNRQGLPLGGAYLRYANQQMTKELLPAAEKLYAAETDRLTRDSDDARLWPFASLALGVLAFGGLFWAQRRSYLQTNRVFNHGLLAATAASTVLLLWLAVGQTVARAELGNAQAHGQESLAVLNDARINSLKARANENLTLVARGAVLAADGNDKYETDYKACMAELGTALGEAKNLADDSPGAEPVSHAIDSVTQWKKRHTSASADDQNGDYNGALKKVIGSGESTGQSFDQVDAALETALGHEQLEFTRSATDGQDALTGLAIGAGVLALVAAVGAILGVGRRLSEYR